MPKKQFYLETGKPAQLEISWGLLWRNIKVHLDGKEVKSIESKQTLKVGEEVSLPNGNNVKFQLIEKVTGFEIQAIKDGQPLLERDFSAYEKLKISYSTIFFVAGIGILFGLVVETFRIQLLLNLGIGFITICLGLLFFLLGILVKKRSMAALGIAVTLFVADAIYTIVTAMQVGINPPIFPIIMRVLLTLQMCQGFSAIKALKREERF